MVDSQVIGRTGLGALILLGFALLACGGADLDQLKARSAFDMKCPEKEIRVKEIDSRTVGVTGCGHRAVYVESCQNPSGHMGGEDCTWVLNSNSTRDD